MLFRWFFWKFLRLSFLICFFFKQKTAYEIMPSLVGSEMCIRDRVYDVWITFGSVHVVRAIEMEKIDWVVGGLVSGRAL